jgi:hypothetical protein
MSIYDDPVLVKMIYDERVRRLRNAYLRGPLVRVRLKPLTERLAAFAGGVGQALSAAARAVASLLI